MGPVPPPDVRLVLPAVPESAAIARHVVAGLLPAEIDGRRREMLLLAVSEAVTHAVLHAHGDGARGTVELRGEATPGALTLTLTDVDGGGAAVRGAFAGSASLAIVASVADSMEARDGRSLRLTFAL